MFWHVMGAGTRFLIQEATSVCRFLQTEVLNFGLSAPNPCEQLSAFFYQKHANENRRVDDWRRRRRTSYRPCAGHY